MHWNKHTIFIKLNATWITLEKAVKHLEMASFGLTCLSCPTSFRPIAPDAVHLIATLLRPMLRRFASYLAYVFRRFSPYVAPTIRWFSPDASDLTGQVRPLKSSANFPIQLSDGPFHWMSMELMYNMEGWTQFFLVGLVQNRPNVQVHIVLPHHLSKCFIFWP